MWIESITLTTVAVPGRPPTYPYAGSFNETPGARSLIVEITTGDGIVGWGETSPWRASAPETAAAQERLLGLLRDRDPFDLERIVEHLRSRPVGVPPALVSGVEMAMWDLQGKAAGRPLCQLLGGAARSSVPLAACSGILPKEQLAELASDLVTRGFRAMKLKVGRDPQEDVDNIRAIRDAVGSALELRIDANEAYAPLEALRLCRRLEEYDLQYFEQPIRRHLLEDAHRLRLATSVPIALNEACNTPQDMLRIARADAADAALPDFPTAGGLVEVRKIAAIAEAAGIPLAMHCGHDLGVKTAAMVQVVAATPAFRYPSDSTYFAFDPDITEQRLPIVDGSIAVPDGPGLGVEVDREKLAHFRVE